MKTKPQASRRKQPKRSNLDKRAAKEEDDAELRALAELIVDLFIQWKQP